MNNAFDGRLGWIYAPDLSRVKHRAAPTARGMARFFHPCIYNDTTSSGGQRGSKPANICALLGNEGASMHSQRAGNTTSLSIATAPRARDRGVFKPCHSRPPSDEVAWISGGKERGRRVSTHMRASSPFPYVDAFQKCCCRDYKKQQLTRASVLAAPMGVTPALGKTGLRTAASQCRPRCDLDASEEDKRPVHARVLSE